jgi:hypothetical protein
MFFITSFLDIRFGETLLTQLFHDLRFYKNFSPPIFTTCVVTQIFFI